jgi:hypothetical protein
VKNDLTRALHGPSINEREIIRYEIAMKMRVSFTAVRMIGTIVYMCARPSVQRRVYGIRSTEQISSNDMLEGNKIRTNL